MNNILVYTTVATVTEKVQCELQSMEQEHFCRGFGDETGKTMWNENETMLCMCSINCRILTLRCRNDNKWQGPHSLPIDREYNSYKLKFGVNIMKKGSNIIHYFRCNDSFSLTGASNASCINGNLSESLPKCNPSVAMKNKTLRKTAKNLNETQEEENLKNEDSSNKNSYFLYIGIALSTIGLASILLTLYLWKRQWKSNRNTTRRENCVAEAINPTFQGTDGFAVEPDYDYPILNITETSTGNSKQMEGDYMSTSPEKN
ncbi:hypothetical protein B566_EDAN005430 [Ephemera danica]|nr:hypothetical protein B566_EDAN005430 [Ephemera danica]